MHVGEGVVISTACVHPFVCMLTMVPPLPTLTQGYAGDACESCEQGYVVENGACVAQTLALVGLQSPTTDAAAESTWQGSGGGAQVPWPAIVGAVAGVVVAGM